MPSAFDTPPIPPHIASARVNELRDELAPELQDKLLALLSLQTAAEWAAWMRAHQPEIQRYDALPKRMRRQALAKVPSAQQPALPSAGAHDVLLLHYAVAWLAVVQFRIAHHLPPQGPPLHDGADQRQALLAIWDALENPTLSEMWPFEVFAEVKTYPFRRDS